MTCILIHAHVFVVFIIVTHGLETATEVKAPPPPNITELGNKTFKKTAEFLNGELAGKFRKFLLCD